MTDLEIMKALKDAMAILEKVHSHSGDGMWLGNDLSHINRNFKNAVMEIDLMLAENHIGYKNEP